MLKPKEKKVILYFVDDDDFHLKVIKGQFENATDYELRTFKNGEDFLENLIKQKTKKHIYQIVILDYYLKSTEEGDAKNGIEILKIIKEINPDIEVIMLSAIEDVDIVTTAMHYGAITFVKKNENSYTRVQNNINWIISQKDMERKKHSHRISRNYFFVILSFILITALIYFIIEHSSG